MPRLKPSALEEKRRIVRAAIMCVQQIRGETDANMALKARMTSRTYKERIKDVPERFTLEELWNMGIPLRFVDEIKEKVL